MTNKPTEYTEQVMENLILDTQVDPPVPRTAIMGNDDTGTWRVIKVNTSGEVVVSVQ